jgi:hypothetical protein
MISETANWVKLIGYSGVIILVAVILIGVRIPGWAWFLGGFWFAGRNRHHTGSRNRGHGGDGGGGGGE